LPEVHLRFIPWQPIERYSVCEKSNEDASLDDFENWSIVDEMWIVHDIQEIFAICPISRTSRDSISIIRRFSKITSSVEYLNGLSRARDTHREIESLKRGRLMLSSPDVIAFNLLLAFRFKGV
jgi:hypothetical protein